MKIRKRVVIGAIFALFFIFILYPYFSLRKDLKVSFLKTLFAWNGVRKINSQVNILFLGIPGPPHDGPDLSDSITVANYDFAKNRLITIGVPRDIWSTTLQDRVNTAYAYGEAKKKGGGLILARAEAGAIIGVPIHHTIVINFSKFRELIDFLDGVDIEVEQEFTDHKFPIEGKENDQCGGKDPDFKCRYKTVRFQQGLQHMSGETALNYVRSRNAEGKEGSDFARTKRQQRIITAIREKLIKMILTMQTSKIRALNTKLDESLARDITNQQFAIIAKDIILSRGYYQKNFALPRELFTVPPAYLYEGMYVLIPQKSTDEVHRYVQCILSSYKEEETCLKEE